MDDKLVELDMRMLRFIEKMSTLSLTQYLNICYKYLDTKVMVDEAVNNVSNLTEDEDIGDVIEINTAYLQFCNNLSDEKNKAITDSTLLGVVRAAYHYCLIKIWNLNIPEHEDALLHVVNGVLVEIYETDETN